MAVTSGAVLLLNPPDYAFPAQVTNGWMEDDPAAYFETAIKDKNPRLFKLSGDRVLVIRRHQHPQYHGNRYASALAGQAVYGKAVVVGRKLARRLGQPRPTLDLHALQALTTKQVKATYADLKIKSAF